MTNCFFNRNIHPCLQSNVVECLFSVDLLFWKNNGKYNDNVLNIILRCGTTVVCRDDQWQTWEVENFEAAGATLTDIWNKLAINEKACASEDISREVDNQETKDFQVFAFYKSCHHIES